MFSVVALVCPFVYTNSILTWPSYPLFCGKVCLNRQLRWRLFCSAFLHSLFREYCFLQKVNILISLFVSKYKVSVHMCMTCTPKDLCMKYTHRTAKGGGSDAHFEINVFVYVRERHSDRWCFHGRPYQQPLLQKMWMACLGYTSQVWNKWDMEPLSALLESDSFFFLF